LTTAKSKKEIGKRRSLV
jgi:3-mercaptopyruvate sulfurtransferase SseA